MQAITRTASCTTRGTRLLAQPPQRYATRCFVSQTAGERRRTVLLKSACCTRAEAVRAASSQLTSPAHTHTHTHTHTHSHTHTLSLSLSPPPMPPPPPPPPPPPSRLSYLHARELKDEREERTNRVTTKPSSESRASLPTPPPTIPEACPSPPFVIPEVVAALAFGIFVGAIFSPTLRPVFGLR
jgi:hypothetical protein